MSEELAQIFQQSMINLAIKLKGRELTTEEQNKLVAIYNNETDKKKTAFIRGKDAVRIFHGYEAHQSLEKTSVVDNIRHYLDQMKDAADNWEKKKE